MGQSNIDTVRGIYEAFGRGDIGALTAVLHDDVRWTIVGPTDVVPFCGTYEGPEAVGAAFATIAQYIDFESFEVEAVLGEDDLVVALGKSGYTVKSTGKPVREDWVHIYRFRNGKVARFDELADTYRAVQAFLA